MATKTKTKPWPMRYHMDRCGGWHRDKGHDGKPVDHTYWCQGLCLHEPCEDCGVKAGVDCLETCPRARLCRGLPNQVLTWEVDENVLMRRLIAPWELTALADPVRRDDALKKIRTAPRGYHEAGLEGYSRRVDKAGLMIRTSLTLDDEGHQKGVVVKGNSTVVQTWHTMTWKEVIARIGMMSPESLAALKDVNGRYLTLQATFKPFFAKGIAVGCGRLPDDESEWTDAHREYAKQIDDYQEWEAMWREEQRLLGEERDAAHDACYASIVEPLDYLLSLFDGDGADLTLEV